jgi:hypothetical protein
MLIRQLKFFISKGDSFSAKSGENDDCVMSMMLSVRMMQILQNWDEKIGDLLRDDFDDQELMEPLPMTMAFR